MFKLMVLYFPETCVVDLGFILDQSSSIEIVGGEGVFEGIILQFVKNAADKYGITQDGVHAGVIVYSDVDKTEVKIHLDDCSDTTCFTEAVGRIEYGTGSTFTNVAMKKAKDELFVKRRANVPAFAVLIADGGQSRDSYLNNLTAKAINAASSMKQDGIKIVAFGIALSKTKDIRLLKTLASPGEYHAVTDFTELETYLDDLMNRVCRGE